MECINVKLSYSRKPLHKLSVWQRRKVTLEVRRNLRYSRDCLNSNSNFTQRNNNIENIPGPSVAYSSQYSRDNVLHDVDDESLSSCSSSSSSHCSQGNDEVALFFEDSSNEVSFRQHLASCFVDNNLTHVQGQNILSLLRTHSCFSNLPKDIRTLIGTPRKRVILSKIEPGEYVHFDVATTLVQCLSNISSTDTINELVLDINTDGCSLYRSGSASIWPIQCMIKNVQDIKPLVVGIYKGTQKPNDPNIFFEKLVADVREIISSGGIDFNGKKIPIRLRCFIADAPARAFILNHRGHMSSRPCSKCKIDGVRCEGRYVFYNVDNSLRTDEDYIKCIDEDHHKGTSPLAMLPLGMVSCVPFEYMHLVCLGVMKKMLSAWVYGQYTRLSKLTARHISIVSNKLIHLRNYCPSEFARRPRSLDACSKFKATEFRQFLLYTGPVVMRGILNDCVYKHFLFLHVAIRILVSRSLSERKVNFAELALKKFVIRSKILYGLTFNSYNIHGLLHLVSDVRRFGNLDSFSAFPYENNMCIFKKYLRKPALPLAQFANRLIEKEINGTNNNRAVQPSVCVSMPYNNNNNDNTSFRHYQKIQFNGMVFSLHARDSCCILHNGLICIIVDIIVDNGAYRLSVKRFVQVENFYDIGILSSAVGIYQCSSLCSDSFFINVEDVQAKCYRMTFNQSSTTDSSNSDEENSSQIDKYVIAKIVHIE